MSGRKMKTVIRRHRLVITIVLYLLSTSTIAWFAIIDYQRVAEGKSPYFTISKTGIADGGTRVYGGLFYIVTDHHSYASSYPRPNWAKQAGDGWAHEVGPELSFWLPLSPFWIDQSTKRLEMSSLHAAIYLDDLRQSDHQGENAIEKIHEVFDRP